MTPIPLTTDMLIEELKKHPGCAVKIRDVDYTLENVRVVEFVAYAVGVNSNGYVWLQT